MNSSYAPPQKAPPPPSLQRPNLLPIYPPPDPSPLPPLPSPPRSPSFEAGYTLTTHLIPACHLRATPDISLPKPAQNSTPKAERQKANADTLKWLQDSRNTEKLTQGYPKILWNCVNRYVRKDLKEESTGAGLTLFFAHANGFPKEIWEPTLAYLLSSPASPAIDEIWVWESVQHGDSALVNASKLDTLHDWADNTRDILNFLLNFLPSSSYSPTALPTHLPRIPVDVAAYRKLRGFTDRTLIAVGHSFGGCTCTLAALIHPRLFSSLILIDPVILQTPPNLPAGSHIWGLARGAIQRREEWTSRQEALTNFSKSPFFGAWDPAVLRLYVECGLYDDPATKTTRLKVPAMQEAVLFSEIRTSNIVWDLLPLLEDRIEIRWVLPGEGKVELGGPGTTQERAWRRPKNTSNVRMAGAGHLITQEAPAGLARDIQMFIMRKYMSGPGLKAKL